MYMKIQFSHIIWKAIYAIWAQQRWHRSACASMQFDQRLCYSLPRLFNIASFYIRYFNPLASLCIWAGQFEFCLIEKPKDRLTHDKAHL